MWSVLKKKMTKSAGYEMSDRESDSGDDCVVVLKKYTKIPSFAEGLSQETTTTTAIMRYENPYEIDATPSTDPTEASTSGEGNDQTILLLGTTQGDPVIDNQMDTNMERTSRDIENNNHEDEAGFGARYEDENANGGGGIHVVSRTLSDLRLAEGAPLRGARLSPPRMKRREKQVPGVPSHETNRPQRVLRSERVSQTDVSYENLHYDPRRRKKDHAPPPPPPPPPLPRDFLSSNSEDEVRSRSSSRLPREFPAGNRLYDLPATNDGIRETERTCPSYPGTIESGYLTLEDVRAQLELARALNRFPDESDGRSNDSRYDGGSEITSEAEGRDSDPIPGDVTASRFTSVSASTAATKNQQRIKWKPATHDLPDADERVKGVSNTEEKVLNEVGNTTEQLMGEPEKLQPVLKSSGSKVVDVHQDGGSQSIEGGPSSGGSTLSAPETDDKDRKKQDMRTLNFRRSSHEAMISGENDLEAAGSDMRVEGLQAANEISEALDIPNVSEPTHMSWDELMQEAQILGIPLYRPAASLCRSDSDRRSSMSSSATSSDLSHASPLQSPKMTRLAGSGPWHRKDNNQKRAKEKCEKKNSPFKGKFKLQNLFAAKKALAAGPKKSDREPAQNLKDTDKEGKLDRIPFRASRLRAFVRSGLESPVLQHYRSGPPSLRSDRGQNLVAELSDNGFRNSSISLRSHVLSSSYSSGSLGSVFSRSSSQTPSSSTSYGKTSASVESPGSSTGTSGSAAILHPSGLSSPPVIVQQSVTMPGIGENWFCHHLPSAANLSSSGNTDFMIGLRQLRNFLESVPFPSLPSVDSRSNVQFIRDQSSSNNPRNNLERSGSRKEELCCSECSLPACYKSSADRHSFSPLYEQNACGWYWGPLGWEEAGMKLTNLSDGSFLVRDSSDDRYILSLSFRSQGLTHHTRIEHYKGVFSFYSQPRSHAASNIVDFIEKAMEQSRSNQYLYFLRPRVAGLPPVPVQLLYPISRFMEIPSLKHICRILIFSLVPRRDLVDQLPLTSSLRRYIKESN